MKVCDNCSRVNPNEAEKCIGCDGEEFTTLQVFQETDDIEPYLREKDDN